MIIWFTILRFVWMRSRMLVHLWIVRTCCLLLLFRSWSCTIGIVDIYFKCYRYIRVCFLGIIGGFKKRLFFTSLDKRGRSGRLCIAIDLLLRRKKMAGTVCRIFKQGGVIVFCRVWLPDCCRNIFSVRYLWRIFVGRGSLWGRNCILCPCCFPQTTRDWTERTSFALLWVSGGLS